MWTMTRHFGALVAVYLVCALSASATTLTVDGVGGGGNFATISDAIQSLGVLGRDATPDVINVTVNALDNHPAILINGTGATIASWEYVSDNITINGDGESGGVGDGTRCRLALGANIGAGAGIGDTTARFEIELALAGQQVLVENFIIVPQTLGAAGGTVASTAIVVDEGPAAGNLAGSGATISNVEITAAADATNAPLDPTVAASASPTFWGGDASSIASCISFLSNNAGANAFTHNVTNCVLAHGRRDAMAILADANGGAGVVNVSGGRCTRTIQGGLGDGIVLSSATSTTVNISDQQCDFNDEHGINCTAVGVAGITSVNINGGCNLSNNSFRGLGSATGAAGQFVISINGTSVNPVTVVGNGNRGIRFDGGATALSTRPILTHEMVNTNNSVQGLEWNEVDLNSATCVVSDCLFANDGSAGTGFGGWRVGDTNVTAATVNVDRSTFHVAQGGAIELFVINAAGHDNVTYNFTDCIFSGEASDEAVHLISGDNNTINLLTCAIVRNGPYALNPTNLIIEVAATGCAINSGTSMTSAPDPLYLSVATNPVVATSFDVNNSQYGGKGSAASNLSGWGDFVGGAVPVELSVFRTN